jgi:hypothetical protein
MSQFDDRLRAGLQRLDAAVPEPAAPFVSVRSSPRRRGRRMLVVLLAATVALLAASAVVVTGTRPPPTPAEQAKNAADEQRVLDDLGRYTADGCLTAEQAKALFRERLNALGLSDWTIRANDSIREAPCVTGGAVGDTHEVMLIPSFGGKVSHAVDNLSAQLMRECRNRDEAVDLLRSTLINAGMSDPKIEVGGIRGIPLEYYEAYQQHVANGCYVYAGSQFDNVGRYTWFIAGP